MGRGRLPGEQGYQYGQGWEDSAPYLGSQGGFEASITSWVECGTREGPVGHSGNQESEVG